MAQYRDPIIAKLIAVLNAEGPTATKHRYFSGDPLVVPKSALPAVFLTKDRSRIGATSTAEDESSIPMVINGVFDMTRDFNQAFDKVNSADSLYEVMEARNADYTLRADSIAYVLRKHTQLDAKLWIALRDPLEIDYGVGIEKRGSGMFTVEAVLRFTITHHQLRPGVS